MQIKAQFDGAFNLLPVGTCLHKGQYRIIRHLASGGFGNTYEAVDVALERRVAIKEFYPKSLCGRTTSAGDVTLLSTEHVEMFTQLRAKFRKEAVRLSQLNNHYIVRVHTYFEELGTAFYVMDYLQGESLSARMKRTGRPLTEAEALKYTSQVLEALAEVHAQNIWHLDLKPANIMVNERDEAVLIDFGASKQLQSIDGYTISTSQNVAYTQGYAPLELVSGDMNKFGPWTDLYSLGATLYALFTMTTPPTAATIMDDGLPALPTSLSASTQELIAWLMQPAKSGRPQSVQEVQTRLHLPPSVPALLPIADVEVVVEESDNDEHKEITLSSQREEAKEEIISPVAPKASSSSWGLLLGFAVVIAVITGVAVNKCSGGEGDSAEEPTVDSLVRPTVDTVKPDTKVATLDVPENCPEVIKKLAANMVYVEGGTFTMGATKEQGSDARDEEKPAHKVTLKGFYIGKYEVTQAEWKAVMGENPSYHFKGDNLPIENVSWDDCQEFIRKLNELTGKNFRLPTEAEWEYAARGGNKSRGYKYSGGNNVDDVAWYGGNSNYNTHPVGTKRANELGLYDMSGNVWEWCQDWYGSYSSSAQTNPTGLGSGSKRVLRGDSWGGRAWRCRLSFRGGVNPDGRSGSVGLRLVIPG
ncbi:MAG: SUMF1/EgtB/PvdO family nonheme iron enzyme [Bacteroidaceae bacterium]|nr:SUMF1/EgtB/PvdO family nonheme iron enzyme [Bacteroidaceae bacterium]